LEEIKEGMQRFKLDIRDELKQVIDQIKPEAEKYRFGDAKVLTQLYETLKNLIEQDKSRAHRLCMVGGISDVLTTIIRGPDEKSRRAACSVFQAVTTNNPKAQQYCTSIGAVNLAFAFDREKKPAMRELILDCLLSLLCNDNFPGKV